MLARTLDKFARNINGDVFTRRKSVTITEFPQGVEVLVNENHETCSDGEMYVEVQRAERGEGDREKNIARAARRAKTQVRRRCKMIGADCMLTLTYRENMQDVERLERDVKAFVKRLRDLGPFEYVLCIEPQKRGALHVHMACQSFPAWMVNSDGVRVKSFNLIRSIWRRVVGRDNGNVDVTRPRGRNAAHRIASYIAKYVAKNVEDSELNAKRYWSSKGIPAPKVTRIWFDGSMPTVDMLELVMADFLGRGYSDFTHYQDRFNEFHWFAASKPS
ncbi:MAG TPA: hypothetical protein VM406_15290 [Noviherbaspirillum sp.]|nr:hypothetical protein [Noviherbaspirillum sp.]